MVHVTHPSTNDAKVDETNAASAPADAGTDTTVYQGRLDREAFDRTAPIRERMNVENAPRYALDAFYASGKALWAVPRVMPHRDDLLTLPKYDIGDLDRFEDLARSLRFVQMQIMRRIQRSSEMPAVAAEGWRIRSMLMSYAEVLSHKGHVDPALIVRLREGGGYRDLVEDLNVLVGEFETLPAGKIGPDASVTHADLVRASNIAHQIHVYVGNVVDAELTQEALLIERQKLGALLLDAHRQLRRGVSFFRWKEEDVSSILPSLHVPAGPRTTTESAADVPPDLAALHAELHAGPVATPPPLDPEDHPFTE